MIAVRAVALDVDGVLTDGGVWWGPNGEEWKRFSFRDIMGVSLARKAGLLVALISGEDSPLVDRFANKLGITDVAKGCKDKAEAVRELDFFEEAREREVRRPASSAPDSLRSRDCLWSFALADRRQRC